MSTNKYSHHDTSRGILKSTSILSLGTFGSRVLGFVRDVILARFLGTGFQADAFFVAFRIPNLFRDVVGEGGINSSVVPVISEYAEKKEKEELLKFLSVVFVLAAIVLSVITISGIVFAPIIVRAIAPGFVVDSEKLNLTIKLTRLMFPYLIFISLTAYGAGILYTLRSFAVPAFSPCLLNISIIISVFVSLKTKIDPVLCLAFGVLVGGILQLAVQGIPIFKKGIRFKWPRTLQHPGAKKIGKLLLPRLLGSAVYQLTVFIDTFCASLAMIVGAGGISAIYYSNRILQFPMGLFGIALASALLPSMSGFAARNDFKEFKRTFNFALKSILFVMLPISIFLMFFSVPIIRLLFQRGEFDIYSTTITSSALLFYSIGLFCFAGVKILVTSFYSIQDTKTPAKTAGFCLVINAMLNFLLMGPLKIGGIALASSIAATINFSILFFILNKRLKHIGEGFLDYGLKVLLASMVMGSLSLWLWNLADRIPEMIRFFLVSFVSIFVFFQSCYFLKIYQAQKIIQWILKKP
ncbi:MAG: murein biosynthesis integral membrane protein MurJ [Candidatus Omnitrophica bacterium]|nr:murein biosynthesis integral membrane protein MurJ [Candidatus Omnitrophota bacterium]